jgi:hypothetical protein
VFPGVRSTINLGRRRNVRSLRPTALPPGSPGSRGDAGAVPSARSLASAAGRRRSERVEEAQGHAEVRYLRARPRAGAQRDGGLRRQRLAHGEPLPLLRARRSTHRAAGRERDQERECRRSHAPPGCKHPAHARSDGADALRIGVRRPVPRGPLGSTQADTPAAAHGERRADGSLTASRVTPLPSFARRAASPSRAPVPLRRRRRRGRALHLEASGPALPRNAAQDAFSSSQCSSSRTLPVASAMLVSAAP